MHRRRGLVRTEVLFKDGTAERFDSIIYATGYKARYTLEVGFRSYVRALAQDCRERRAGA